MVGRVERQGFGSDTRVNRETSCIGEGGANGGRSGRGCDEGGGKGAADLVVMVLLLVVVCMLSVKGEGRVKE